jgi:hypothetical protein
VWPVLVVVLAPVLDRDLRLGEGEKISTARSSSRMREPKGLDVGVLRRRAGLDVSAAGVGEAAPVPQLVGGELRAAITADELR